jgi:hypothetical protein
MKKTIFAALGLIWALASADAQQFSADEITRTSSGAPSKLWSRALSKRGGWQRTSPSCRTC